MRLFVRTAAIACAVALAVISTSCGADDDAGDGAVPASTPVNPGERTMFPPVEKEIGREGGRLDLQDGTSLEIPEGALAEKKMIKATVVRFEEGTKQIRYYHLEPAGLTFAKPATLRTKVQRA